MTLNMLKDFPERNLCKQGMFVVSYGDVFHMPMSSRILQLPFSLILFSLLVVKASLVGEFLNQNKFKSQHTHCKLMPNHHLFWT